MTKEEAIKILKDFHDKSALFSVRTALETLYPELKESEDEKVRKELLAWLKNTEGQVLPMDRYNAALAWLEKQGEQKPTQEIEPFEAEHDKYYYCIKDYFCGGRKQASKGDVVQALRGLPIMGLKDAGEYFLPVNSIKCNSAWSEEDEKEYKYILKFVDNILNNCGNKKDYEHCKRCYDWLKSLKTKVQPKQEWSEEDGKMINKLMAVVKLYYVIDDDLDKQRCLSWLESLTKNRRIKL